ncbi:dATP/dGTP pyrophosphohydrolase domain-containing protein [Mycobacterium sp. PSTR-4-N]|uniref:dATP/dGTP pyrophosphohydrolase domain-containing protein n=1 Tax=Mycobacterium sp. PSTR-4-N TaxID=2917745 RepID=UPI001F149C15|nr:dATP/dGTP pyrophosphohydrolase domain-containing protein [Mycobacterium sp. PSTR-4-N]MCG7596309.1 DUF550 domain-containing protein [Mycobacterium sp. PSTR-4-N]
MSDDIAKDIAALIRDYWPGHRTSIATALAIVEKYGIGKPAIDAAHIAHQREWSLATFGPGARTNGVLDHIAKELDEIRSAPDDLSEWADVIILALDGAQRTGADPQEIIAAVKAKQAKNEARVWPDWRDQDPDKAIEHDRGVTA